MTADVVRLERRADGVAIVTLDRPPMNAVDESFVRGLVDATSELAVDEDVLEQRVLDFAAGLARQAPLALRAIKRAIGAAGTPAGYEVERDGFREVLLSEDAQTGVAAFFAGDRPRFEGR